MKKIMKKALSLVLVLAMTIVPMTAYAATLGEYDNPYLVSVGADAIDVNIDVESGVYVKADNSNGSILTVEAASHASYNINYCRMNYVPESGAVNNAMLLPMVADVDFVYISNTGDSTLSMKISLEGGEAVDTTGTVGNPEAVVLEENPRTGVLGAYVTKELEAGRQGYYYTCVAPEDGTIVVSVSAFDAEFNEIGWMFNANNITAGLYGETYYSDDEEVAYEVYVDVKKDDEVTVMASTYDPSNPFTAPAGNVAVSYAFAAVGSASSPVDAVEGENVADITAGSQGYNYTWVAEEDGVVTITMDTEKNTNGWLYQVNNITAGVYGDTHWHDDEVVVSEEIVKVVKGDEITIMVNTYDAQNPFSAPAGTVNWSFDFVAADSDVSDDDTTGEAPETPDTEVPEVPETPDTEIPEVPETPDTEVPETPDTEIPDDETTEEENYVIVDTELQVGTNNVAIVPNVENTLYSITLEDNGDDKAQVYKYTLTVSEGKIGYWGTTFFPNDATADKTQTVEVNLSEGAAILVGVCDATSETITITVAMEEVVKQEVKETIYTNKVTPQPFKFTGDEEALLYPDLEDGVEDKAVLGADGYYHLNTADGPVLFVDLNDVQLSIATATDYGQLKDYFYDEEGNPLERVDYNAAVIEYYKCADEATGLYPLTEDLIEVYQKVGAEKGWYTEDSIVVGFTEADAWMFACYYDETILTLDGGVNTPDVPSDDNTSDDTTTGGDTDDEDTDVPETGDNANVILWVAVLGLGAVAVATGSVMKKRTF